MQQFSLLRFIYCKCYYTEIPVNFNGEKRVGEYIFLQRDCNLYELRSLLMCAGHDTNLAGTR